MGPRGQEPNESTDDAVWQDLVARLEGTSADPAPPHAPGSVPRAHESTKPWTDDGAGRERADAQGDSGSGTPGDSGPTDRERADAIFRNQPFRSSGPRDSAPVEAEDDEGFTPAEPPPLGSGDPLTVLAWIGAAGGPVLLLLFAMFWRNAPLAATLGILALFLAGAGYLVTKLPKNRDMGDDGAEV